MRPQPIEGGLIIAAGGEAGSGLMASPPVSFAVADTNWFFLMIDEQAAVPGKAPFRWRSSGRRGLLA